MLHIKQVCKILNVSERAFLTESKNKQFPFLTKIGQNYVVHEKAFYNWLANGNTNNNNNESEN